MRRRVRDSHSAVTFSDEVIISWADCTFLLDMNPCLSQDSFTCRCNNLSRAIIHLRTVLQPELCRSPEHPGCARTSIAAQTQPFEKATYLKDTPLTSLAAWAFCDTDAMNRNRHRTQCIISALGKTTSATTHAPQPCPIVTLSAQQRTKTGSTPLNNSQTRAGSIKHAIITHFYQRGSGAMVLTPSKQCLGAEGPETGEPCAGHVVVLCTGASKAGEASHVLSTRDSERIETIRGGFECRVPKYQNGMQEGKSSHPSHVSSMCQMREDYLKLRNSPDLGISQF
ncbi:hypothetical protein BU25DRAFT_444549 [Macroventuria anomochaeta]|uniref:Uncharacterized protein n=1 Tax=Macroventuria anomochaeta TaxID=301207 RepID=A0ACB6SI26_9PLEO|nr:uncharacterized protein BU25DRAFT_444549 [Macroventuria anomochaeta]KAF2633945.1 hypothetical protein BU25DRAFT_444549 [Macroventuria anomochaeta]